MPISNELIQFIYSQNDQFSLRTNWHQQYLIENIADLRDFITSISNFNKIEPSTDFNYSFGYFQIDPIHRVEYVRIIFLFAILERRIRALIGLTTELKKDVTKDISDYKGSFLERVKSFLKENLDIDLLEDTNWENLIMFQKVRDCIIHCGGNILESRDYNYLKDLSDIGIINTTKNNYIIITDEFHKKIEDSIITFIVSGLNKLYDLLVILYKNKD